MKKRLRKEWYQWKSQESHRKCQHAKVSEVSTFSNNEVICNVGSSSYYKEYIKVTVITDIY